MKYLSESPGKASAGDPPSAGECLSQTERTRVSRERVGDGFHVICKQALGSDALRRVRHERGTLLHLAGVKGVVRLAPAALQREDALLLEDRGGESLASALREQRPTLDELLALALQLARILAAVHQHGVVHKDVNPSNIVLVGPQREPLLIDFDLASRAAEEQPGFTHPSEIAGTLAYIAPEQTGRTGRAVDQRSDLYALGATLYELATGRRPFSGDDMLALIHAHLARAPQSPAVLVPTLPKPLSDIVLRLLEKDADRRYQSAEGLAHDLARLIERLARGDASPFALGERDFASRLAPPSRLVGRDDEAAALREVFEGAVQARGRVLLVSGPAGVGKTTLVNELRVMVTARRGWFVTARFDQYRPDAAAGPVVQAMRALGTLLLAEPEEQVTLWRTRLREVLGVNARLLAAAVPEFALLLGIAPEGSPSDLEHAAQRLRQGVFDMLRTLASADRPLVLVIDNLQWCAPRTVTFFEEALTDGNLPGVLLVGTYRDNEIDPGHPLLPALARWALQRVPPQQLALHNLPPHDLIGLLQRMLRQPLAQATALAQAVGERTGGNPFDTVELINALRRDGVLVPAESEVGWRWDDELIRHYVGRGDVVDLLALRIERLPGPARGMIEMLACLGSEVRMSLLQAACDLPPDELDARLAPALADGLLVLDTGGPLTLPASVRFRHDRVQQAAYARLPPVARRALHLTMARRLVPMPEFAGMAAEQYLAAVGMLYDAGERRHVIELFRSTATGLLLTNHAVAERFLAAAIGLFDGIAKPADAPLLLALQTKRIVALYVQGRHDDLDAAYRSLEPLGHEPHLLTAATCMRVNSLNDRSLHAEALELGLSLLRRLGLDLAKAVAVGDEEAQWARFYEHAQALDVETDLRRPPIDDPRLLAIADLLERLQVPAFFLMSPIASQLVFEGLRLWSEYGPCARLMHVLGGAVSPLVTRRNDYKLGYQLLRHALAIGEAHGWEPDTADTRHYHALLGMPWFEPIEDTLAMEQRSREGLLQWGLLPQAAYTYVGTAIALFETSPTLDATAEMAETAIAHSKRIGSPQSGIPQQVYRQLVLALRGETRAPGSLQDEHFDEAQFLTEGGRGVIQAAAYHSLAALAAAIFGDGPALARHAPVALSLGGRAALYRVAIVRALRALSLAQELPSAAPEQRAGLLAEFDTCHAWLKQRAVDAPANFEHLAQWLAAERAWATGDLGAADAGFTRALRLVEPRARPWHKALMAERAGLFALAHGPQHLGEHLLARACEHYANWGARGKVRELLRQHAFLAAGWRQAPGPHLGHASAPGVPVSSDALDMVAIVRASQALSSETSLARLKLRVAELLGALTGASSVLLVLRGEEGAGWFVSEASDDAAASISVEDAAARKLLPITAFRYALRTNAPLVVDDAAHDDRFARDPYLATREHCSLLVVPILSHGEAHAVLMLENRLARGAFAGDRLDAVTLIAGQLAVSLDNALLYASLERKVAQRTADLQELVSGLQSFNRSVSHDLRGPLGGISGLAMMAMQALERGDDNVARRVLPAIAQQADSSTRLVATLLALARAGDTQLRWQAVEIGALVHEVIDQLAQAEPRRQLPEVSIGAVPTVYADVDLLRPVMVNLLSNAIKFVRGRPAPRIEIAGTADEREVTVSVCDNGVGFASDAARSLFEPFTRLHGSAFEGYGVGLSIVRRAVERHGGRVWARSMPDQGACFYFTLPCTEPVAAPAPTG